MFPIQATITAEKGEVFVPNPGPLASHVNFDHDVDYDVNRHKVVKIIGYPHLLEKALNQLIYKKEKLRP